ncbi:uncharacterized protein LOC143427167 [Xylocopa sonorina]|uniref:uncharacterized protein LOC143427167 n=1 Tax=Xylocopa sonorina TaxID=1818115 RepID=UPI00403A8DA2
MLHSKATAALMRLKEMDKKYNIKRNEGRRVQSYTSAEGPLENSSKSQQVKSKAFSDNGRSSDGKNYPVTVVEEEPRTKVPFKSKVEVKIPINPAEVDGSSVSDSVTLNQSSRVHSEMRSMLESNKNVDVEEESDVLETNESPESLPTLGTTSKASAKDLVSRDEDFPRDGDELSVNTALSQRSDVSDIISEAIKSVSESSSRKSDGKLNVPEVTAVEDSVPLSNTDNNETTIEEAIKISDERRESNTELSNAMNKEDSVENVSSKEVQKSQYDDDTFEEAFSSVGSSSSVEENPKKLSEEDTMVSGVKQINITLHKETEDDQKETVIDEGRDKEIVELVPPKVMQSKSECDIGLDEELSNYVKTTENVDEVIPISLLKLSKQIVPPKKHAKGRKNKKHRKSSNENTEEKTDTSVAAEHEKLTGRKENNAVARAVGEKGSWTSTKSVESEKENRKETFLSSERNEEERIDEMKSEAVMENCATGTISNEEVLLKEIPKKSDVTSTLRKLNKDAINAIVRQHKVETPKDAVKRSRHCKNCGSIVMLPTADTSKNVEDNDSIALSTENVKTTKDFSHDQRIKEKKAKSKKAVRSSKNRKSSNYNKVDAKHSRFDCRQAHRLRKHATAFRLQQEREDIRNYLLELERTRLEFGPGETGISHHLSAFKQLEFPKIAAFVKPDLEDSNFRAKDEITRLQERILMIRQWLKDQYILYRDYSSLAQTVNSKYIPASLEDAKKTIRQLQRATIKSR